MGKQTKPAAAPAILIPFRRTDQYSTALLIENILSVDDGFGREAEYHLHFNDDLSALKIQETIERFSKARRVFFTNRLDRAVEPQSALVFERNTVAFEFLKKLDRFLMLESDCLILRDNWLRILWDSYNPSGFPIFGELVRTNSDDPRLATRYSACAIYNGAFIGTLALQPERSALSNKFSGPLGKLIRTWTKGASYRPSKKDFNLVPYENILYIACQVARAKSDDPIAWNAHDLANADELIGHLPQPCIHFDEMARKGFGKAVILHGVRDDRAKHAIIAKLRGDDGSRSYGLSGDCLEAPIDYQKPLSDDNIEPAKFSIISRRNDRFVSMEDLRNEFCGKRVFLIGNGPSLRNTDLRKIAGEYTIGLNRIYLNYKNMGFEPTFYCCTNPLVLEQFCQEIDGLGSVKFLGASNRSLFKKKWNTFFMESIPAIGFTSDLSKLRWHEGWTVTYCGMQTAYHLGFKEVVLVGVDHHFANAGEPNQTATSHGDDTNHFDKDYFGKGVAWQYPDLARSEQHYLIAKDEFEKAGRRIVDATIGGKLHIFEKEDYSTYFGS